MNTEQNKFFMDLIVDRNFLGAAQYLKELSLDGAERSALMAKVIDALVTALDSARINNDRERTVYLRSLLAWLLRDYPGLASMYREQVRIATGNDAVLPDLLRGIRNAGDVFTGRKTVQEGVHDASEPLENLGGQAGELLKEGLNQIGEFFAGFSRQRDKTDESAESGESDESGNGDEGTADSGDSEDQPGVEVKIENADDPLPHDIHKTD